MFVYLTYGQVVELHARLMAKYGAPGTVIAPEKLEAALHRPLSEAFGQPVFESLPEKAAALLQGLVVAHAFLDGNKRIALAATLLFIRLNGERSRPRHADVEELTLAIASGDLRDVDEIALRVQRLFFER